MCNFLIYDPQRFYCFLCFECFNLGIGTIISLDIFGPQQIEIPKVYVLPGKYNTYGENLMVYGYSLMKRQPLERNNNMSSKTIVQFGVRMCYACKLGTTYV